LAASLATRLEHLALRLQNLVQSVLSPVSYAVAGAVIDDRGRVLLVRHSYKTGLQLPMGGVDRGEPASLAVLRELREEIGLVGGEASLFAVYTRRGGLVTNVIVLYRITGATIEFQPNWEVRQIEFVDPAAPPPECTPDTCRRLEELGAACSPRPYW